MQTFKDFITEGLNFFKADMLNDKTYRVIITDYRGVKEAVLLDVSYVDSLKKNEEFNTMFGNYVSITWKKKSNKEIEYIKSSLTRASGDSQILKGDEKFAVKFP